jgi:hypothetical protein
MALSQQDASFSFSGGARSSPWPRPLLASSTPSPSAWSSTPWQLPQLSHGRAWPDLPPARPRPLCVLLPVQFSCVSRALASCLTRAGQPRASLRAPGSSPTQAFGCSDRVQPNGSSHACSSILPVSLVLSPARRAVEAPCTRLVLVPDLPWLSTPARLGPLLGVFSRVDPAQPPFSPARISLLALLLPRRGFLLAWPAMVAMHAFWPWKVLAQATVAPREMVCVPTPSFRFHRVELCSVLAVFSASDLWRHRELVSHCCLVHASTRSWSRRPSSPTFYYQFDYRRCCVRSRSLSPARPCCRASPGRSSCVLAFSCAYLHPRCSST